MERIKIVRFDKTHLSTFFQNLKTAVEQYAQAQGNTFLTSKTRDAITFLELLTTEYDVATANPPYTDSADFGPELKKFIEANYKKPHKFHTNLYASFIKRCYELTGAEGKIAMIHPRTFMFIKTFEDVRKFMIEKTHIDILVDYGLDRVNLFGPGILVDATFYVLSKSDIQDDGLYFNVTTNLQEKYKKENNNQDFGFKVFKLDKSNFNLKDEFKIPEDKDAEELKKKYLDWLGMWVNEPLITGWKKIDVIYETMLKQGLNLNSTIEEIKIKNNDFYYVKDKEQDLDFYISLDNKIENDAVEEISTPRYKDKMFVFLDKALTDNDKINLSAFVKLKVI